MNRLVSVIASITALVLSTTANAQVIVVGYSGVAVPISPWLAMATAIVLAALSVRLLRKKSAAGFFVAVLAVMSGSFALYQERAEAISASVALTGTSPASSADLG